MATVVMKSGYRADGLRAWKENAQGVRTYFLYDGSNLVAEFDSSGTMTASQTWGAEGLAYRRTASGNRFYSWDVRGNIAATTDSTGAVLNTPSSDGFSSQGGSEPCATFGGQVGGYFDSETGLVLFGQRYYDSALGSWLTRDPIAEAGGINLYSYVQGNPVNRLDPLGLFQLPKGFAKKYPKTAKRINTLVKRLNKKKYAAFKKCGPAGKKAVDEAFTPGKGPFIVSNATLSSKGVNGQYVEGSNKIELDLDLIKAYEAGKASGIYLDSTVEHETVHYFDAHDKKPANKYVEAGIEYEKSVYGKNIGAGAPDWND